MLWAAGVQSQSRSPAKAVETKELYSSANGDRWCLVRARGSGHVFVRHEPNAASGGRNSEIGSGEFLVRGGHGPEHQELMRLIGMLVEGGSRNI